MKDKPKSKRVRQTKEAKKPKKAVYGFKVGIHVINIDSDSEQNAMATLVKNFWQFLDDNGTVELLGKQTNIING